MAVSRKLDDVSQDVKAVSKDVESHSKAMANFNEQVTALTGAVKLNADESSRFCATIQEQIAELKRAREDLKQEVYDFKLIKSELKSKLISDLTDDFRAHLKEEAAKLDTDVKRFNELKEELSGLVSKFRDVESEVDKFREIAKDVKSADFELSRHAREIAKADQEKLRLMQKIDHLERLISKMRRNSR